MAFAGERRLAQITAGARVGGERAGRAGSRRGRLSAHGAFLTAAAAVGRAAATATRAARGLAAAAQRGHSARGFFGEANRQHPLFLDILALRGWGGPGRLAVQPLALAAALDQIADIDGIVRAQDDVIATGAQRISRGNRDLSFAGMAKDLKTADNTPAVQIAIVQFVFFDDVMIETVEVLFSQ